MDITLTPSEAEVLPEPSLGYVKKTKPLLNSNYKATAEQSFTKPKASSVFVKRQHLKFNRYNDIIPAGVIVRLSLFAIVLSMIL